jgi:hypothetical protein
MTLCKNCGEKIEEKTYLWKQWMHVDGIEFTGYRHCKTTVAEPKKDG